MRKFKIGYYNKFILPEGINIPENLQVTLQYIWNRKYMDFYEDNGGDSDVEEAFEELLDAFGKPNNVKQHKRYLYIAFTMALASQSIIKHYYPENNKIYVYTALATALEENPSRRKKVIPQYNNLTQHDNCFDKFEDKFDIFFKYSEKAIDLAKILFPNINKIGKYQAVDEANNVLYNCLQTFNKELAYESVLDILYDAITGEAIAGFALSKRDIFNWLLIEVIPYAYYLQLPPNIYSEKYRFKMPKKVS